MSSVQRDLSTIISGNMTNTLLSHDSELGFKAKLEAAKQLAIDKANRDAHSINAELSYGKPSVFKVHAPEIDMSTATCEIKAKTETELGQRTELFVPDTSKKASPVNDILATGRSNVSNLYAGLTARKRKHTQSEGLCKGQSTETGDVPWRMDHNLGDDQFSGRRIFAPTRKPVGMPHIEYEKM